MVISSWVIHSSDSFLEEIKSKLAVISNIEVTEEREFKLAVVIETTTTEEAADLANQVRGFEGVTGLDIVSHFFEEEVLKDNNKQK